MQAAGSTQGLLVIKEFATQDILHPDLNMPVLRPKDASGQTYVLLPSKVSFHLKTLLYNCTHNHDTVSTVCHKCPAWLSCLQMWSHWIYTATTGAPAIRLIHAYHHTHRGYAVYYKHSCSAQRNLPPPVLTPRNDKTTTSLYRRTKGPEASNLWCSTTGRQQCQESGES